VRAATNVGRVQQSICPLCHVARRTAAAPVALAAYHPFAGI
jgi:hypothetical protein